MSAPTQRAQQFATELEAVNNEIIATVTECTDEQWRTVTASEGWPVGVTAHHMAQVQGFFGGVLPGITSGETGLLNLDEMDVDGNNAQHARDFADVGKQETLEELQTSGTAILRQIRTLSDEQLDGAAMVVGGQEMNVTSLLELGLIGHFREHLASMHAAITN